MNQVDFAGAELLLNETRERRKLGGDFFMYRLKDSAARVLRDGGYFDYIGEYNIFDSKEEAISQIFDRLDKNICATCEQRIFRECNQVPLRVAAPVVETGKDEDVVVPSAKKKVRKKSSAKKAAKKQTTKKKSKTRKKTAAKQGGTKQEGSA